ncbi:MAG: hypothetical protein Q4G59_11490, partial [Planctomycetia bacterium]|nr:hypothetical protein [Planctomycetia bacterium]
MKHNDSKRNRSNNNNCQCGHPHTEHDNCEDELYDDIVEDGLDEDDEAPDLTLDMAYMREVLDSLEALRLEIEKLKEELHSRYDKKRTPVLVEKMLEYAVSLGVFERPEEQAALQDAVDQIRTCKPEQMPDDLRRQLIDTLCEMGSNYLDQEDYDHALECYQDSFQEAESFAAKGDEMAKIDIGGILLNKSAINMALKQDEKARSLVLQAIERLRVTVTQKFADMDNYYLARATLGKALMVRSQQLLDDGNASRELAVSTAKEAVDIFRKMRDEGDTDFLDDLGSHLLFFYGIDSENRSKQESIDILN